MKIITVKTIFEGKVAFPEKYYKPKARVKVGTQMMSLIGKKPVGYSEYMDDKFGRGKYRLIYFTWSPDQLTGKAKKEKEAFDKYNKMSEEEKFYNGY